MAVPEDECPGLLRVVTTVVPFPSQAGANRNRHWSCPRGVYCLEGQTGIISSWLGFVIKCEESRGQRARPMRRSVRGACTLGHRGWAEGSGGGARPEGVCRSQCLEIRHLRLALQHFSWIS